MLRGSIVNALSQTKSAFDDSVVERKRVLAFDGTPLSVQMLGEGDEPCLLANGIGTDYRAFRFIIEHFYKRFRFYSWNARAHFDSGRSVKGAYDIKDHAADVHAIMRACSLQRPHAMGWSMGGQILIEATRENGRLFKDLVLVSALPGRLFDTATVGPGTSVWLPPLLRALRRVDGGVHHVVKRVTRMKSFREFAIRLGFLHHDFARISHSDVFEYVGDADMSVLLTTLLKLHEHDAYDVLADMRFPTLMFAPTHDLMTPLSAVKKVGEAIDKCRIVTLAGASHYALCEMPDAICRETEVFLNENSTKTN